jgi:hypothetical protein
MQYTKYYKDGTLNTRPKVKGISNPTHEQIVADGWMVYVFEPPTVGEFERLELGGVDAIKGQAVQQFSIVPNPPTSISLVQCKAELNRRGVLSAVDGVINSIGGDVLFFWQHATTVERDTQLIQDLAQQLQIDLDDFFKEASKIKL